MDIVLRIIPAGPGNLLLGSHGNKLCLCDWKNRRNREAIDRRICTTLNARMVKGDSPVIRRTEAQINAFLAGRRKDFSIPYITAGTPFQEAVWKTLLKIPYGKTISYGDLARCIRKPDAVRAVASAVGANALSLIIPCHRIIGKDGNLTGYAGGIAAKKKLLQVEDAL